MLIFYHASSIILSNIISNLWKSHFAWTDLWNDYNNSLDLAKIKMEKMEKIKVVELKFEDGEKWQIPLSHIAKHRTDYYKNRAIERGKTDFNYEEEYNFVMNDDYEGEDWLKNNMDYDDFKKAVKIIEPELKSQKDWANAESNIIEVLQQ